MTVDGNFMLKKMCKEKSIIKSHVINFVHNDSSNWNIFFYYTWTFLEDYYKANTKACIKMCCIQQLILRIATCFDIIMNIV